MEIKTVTIHIEGKPYEVEAGRNLLETCLSLGFDVPHFCWHPALGSIGACRQCAVKQFRDEKDTRGQIIMSCMTPVTGGMRIAIHDPEVVKFRASVIEWLMINHPHDCPVCDEGGECHLQDMTVMTGHRKREYRFKKRTYRNQNLGPFINHEMNRCIQCYRCVRFYRNTAGGRDLNVFGAHDHLYFGRYKDGTLENEFSGNLVEICPTGVFTDKTQKAHNTRNWDLQTAPSICVHCGLGCNTLPGERYGLLRRIRNRFNHTINGYFLCDRGRFGYEFVNSQKRLRTARFRNERDSQGADIPVTELLDKTSTFLKTAQRVIGIGSPRASLEANAALRNLVGPENFHAGVSRDDHRMMALVKDILTQGPARTAGTREAAHADAVLVLGEDVTQTAPILALSLRQMGYEKAAADAKKVQLPSWDDSGVRQYAQNAPPDLFIAATHETRLDDAAKACFHAGPDDLAALGFAVENALNANDDASVNPDDPKATLATKIAKALKNAERPLVVTGVSLGSEDLVHAAANIAWTLCNQGKDASIMVCLPECNSMGLALMDGLDLTSAFDAIENEDADTVIVLENDLYRRAPGKTVDAFFEKASSVIVLDHLNTPTADKADILFPVTTFAEGSGILVNNEGRAQQFHAVFPPHETIRESFRILSALTQDVDESSPSLKRDIIAGLAQALPVFEGLDEPHPPLSVPAPGGKVPRQSFGYSGRTAMNANRSVHEPQPPQDPDSPFSFSMEGFGGKPPADLVTHFWSPGWNSIQAVNRYQSTVGGPLNGEPTGRRLIEPGSTQAASTYGAGEASAPLKGDERILVRIDHLFGSEELSMVSGAVAGQAPEPYLALGPDDPMASACPEVGLVYGGETLNLKIKLLPGLGKGLAGIPAGLPGIPAGTLPVRVVLTRGGDQ